MPGGLVLRPVLGALQVVFGHSGRGQHGLDDVGVLLGTGVAGSGKGHLRPAQRHTGFHRCHGLERLERGARKDGRGDVAQGGDDASVRGHDDGGTDVAGLNETVALDNG